MAYFGSYIRFDQNPTSGQPMMGADGHMVGNIPLHYSSISYSQSQPQPRSTPLKQNRPYTQNPSYTTHSSPHIQNLSPPHRPSTTTASRTQNLSPPHRPSTRIQNLSPPHRPSTRIQNLSPPHRPSTQNLSPPHRPSTQNLSPPHRPSTQNLSPPHRPSTSSTPDIDIRGSQDLIAKIGYPDIIDGRRGGIAIWSGDTLKKRGYGFLHRVEILDEAVASASPVKHFSNIYIWVPMTVTLEMLNNIHSLSKDYYYDRKKELMIIRSDTLDTCVAQAALIMLYANNKLSFYNIVNNNLAAVYYESTKKPKTLKAMYTIVNTSK
jgi:hypothetical protein